MPKARIDRKKNAIQHDDTVLFNMFSEESVRGSVIGVYGRGSTGKTVLLAYEAARLARKYGGKVLYYHTETNRYIRDISNALESIFKAFNVPYEVKGVSQLYRIQRELTQLRAAYEGEDVEALVAEAASEGSEEDIPPRVVVIDSLTAIFMEEAARYSVRVRSEPRGLSSRSGIQRFIASTLAGLVGVLQGWGFVTMHASSVAGSGLYYGIATEKPSYGSLVMHYLNKLIWLFTPASAPDNVKKKIAKLAESGEINVFSSRIATVVASRTGDVGTSIVFEIRNAKEGDVEYPRPTPLLKFRYEVDVYDWLGL